IEQLRSPTSTIRRNVACSSRLSGVVWLTFSTTPPIRCSTVPSRPGRRPAASRMAYIRKAVVVLPLVPVIPTTSSCALGRPKKASAATASALRDDETSSWGTSRGRNRSTASATAPRSTAISAKSCPSARNPGTPPGAAPGGARGEVVPGARDRGRGGGGGAGPRVARRVGARRDAHTGVAAHLERPDRLPQLGQLHRGSLSAGRDGTPRTRSR